LIKSSPSQSTSGKDNHLAVRKVRANSCGCWLGTKKPKTHPYFASLK
jgi:hypothetical protein